MANINEILARAAALRDETALNSIDPERAGSIMYDTLIAMNELWLQQGAALVISKIYASVAAMQADTSPVSDLTGKPIRPGQIVVIASSNGDNGSVYRYNGTGSPRWSLIGNMGDVMPVDGLDSDSTTRPLAAKQGMVLDKKISDVEFLINGKPLIYFRRRFIADGYTNDISNYCCTQIIDGDGREYTFPKTSDALITYKVFQYISDTEGQQLTPSGWQNNKLTIAITGKFIVTFNGTFTTSDRTAYDWLVQNYAILTGSTINEEIQKLKQASVDIGDTNTGFLYGGKDGVPTSYVKQPQVYSKNLLNKNAPGVMLGYRQFNENPQANASYNLSDYIPVIPGKQYVSSRNGSLLSIPYVVAFKRDLSFARYIGASINTFTPQDGEVFVKVTYGIARWAENIQLEQAASPTDYEPYGDEFLFPKVGYPRVVMPSKIFVYGGLENSIYHENYLEYRTDDILIAPYRDYEASFWKFRERCFRTTMTSAQTLAFYLRNARTLKALEYFNITTVVGNPSVSTGAPKVLCIGDSFTYDGRYIKQISDLCPNITTVGMREPTQASAAGLRCEGRGGWTLDSYTKPYWSLSPTGMQPFSPFVQAAGYNYYGPTPFWKVVVNGGSQNPYGTNGFGDFASWFDSNGYKLNPSVNDLMYDGTNFVAWNGSAWVALGSAPEFAFDFSKYISIWQISAPDFILIFLGKNDFHDGVSGWDDFKTNLDALISSIRTYSATVKIGICIPTVADEAPNNSDSRNAKVARRNMWNARKLMIGSYDGQDSSNIFIVDTGTVLDPDYGFVLEEQLPFAFYTGSERELYSTNGVHPSGAGYKQIGTCIAGFIQAKR